jgi:hypothetical protein
MSDFVNDDDGLVIDHETSLPVPPLVKKTKRIDLSNLRAIKREMCKVYADSRNGVISVEDASKFSYQLQAIAKVTESVEISQRLDRLEKLNQ